MKNKPCSTDGYHVIAEAGLNHNGSMDVARKLIDVATVAGVDAVKFQKRTVEKLAVKAIPDAKEYSELMAYTESKGLDFMVTAFDTDTVRFLLGVGVIARAANGYQVEISIVAEGLTRKLLATDCSVDALYAAKQSRRNSRGARAASRRVAGQPPRFPRSPNRDSMNLGPCGGVKACCRLYTPRWRLEH